jgi:hypothetical protein
VLAAQSAERITFIPHGPHDDQVDALGLIGQLLDTISVDNPPAPIELQKRDNSYLSSIAALGSVPNLLVTSPAKGRSTVQALIAAAKEKPGTFNFTSAAVGRLSDSHECRTVPSKSRY